MASVYSAIYGNSDYWDGTTAWGYDATSDEHNPTAHPNQAARDAQYSYSYTSLSAWEVDRDGNANAGDDEYAIIQTPWTADDTAAVSVNFTNAVNSYTIKAIGAARTDGVYDESNGGPYRLKAANTVWLLSFKDTGGRLDGVQLYNTEAVDTSNAAFYTDSGDVEVSDCVIISENSEGATFNSGGTGKIWNCVIYCPDSGGQEGLWVDSVSTFTGYNLTIRGFDDGIEVDAVSASCALKNIAVMDNTDDIDDAVGVTKDYIASDDGDGTNPQSGLTWTDEFNDYPNDDYSVKAGATLIGNGTDDPSSGEYSDDIAGNSRSSTWDIGAFEYVSVGGISIPIVMLQHNQFEGGRVA